MTSIYALKLFGNTKDWALNSASRFRIFSRCSAWLLSPPHTLRKCGRTFAQFFKSITLNYITSTCCRTISIQFTFLTSLHSSGLIYILYIYIYKQSTTDNEA